VLRGPTKTDRMVRWHSSRSFTAAHRSPQLLIVMRCGPRGPAR
jgi:hypothetical protein